MDIEERFPPEVTEILTKCGWFEGRKVGDENIEFWRNERLISDGVDMPRAAKAVLKEFGGLTIISDGRGVDCARLSMEFDPSSGDGGQFLKNYVDSAGVKEFYPLGAYGDGDGTFLIEPGGAVYADFQLDSPIGKNIDEALVKLLLGIR
ncbi:MAG: SUKH-3 domain-containing protein [Chloracidobacterium sp.]|nr:SUKH-3 domain-containing protein [Chloracidobacterium sp.]